MRALVLLLLGTTPLAAQRTYWPVSVDSLAAGQVKHTHIEVRGLVTYTSHESDGDLHIRLRSLSGSGAVIIAECIPTLPCRKPAIGDTITIRGISRRDGEHGWWEVHLVEWMSP